MNKTIRRQADGTKWIELWRKDLSEAFEWRIEAVLVNAANSAEFAYYYGAECSCSYEYEDIEEGGDDFHTIFNVRGLAPTLTVLLDVEDLRSAITACNQYLKALDNPDHDCKHLDINGECDGCSDCESAANRSIKK